MYLFMLLQGVLCNLHECFMLKNIYQKYLLKRNVWYMKETVVSYLRL